MNSNDSNPNASVSGEVLINGVPANQFVSDVVYDTKRVFVLYSETPDAEDVKKRAKNLKRAWEKLHGKDSCEVAVVHSNERVESLV